MMNKATCGSGLALAVTVMAAGWLLAPGWAGAVSSGEDAGAAGSARLAGTVVDSATGEPVVNANVVVENSHLGSTTDLDGRFEIRRVPAGEGRLVVSHLNYAARKVRYRVGEEETARLRIALEASPMELDEVVYTATRTMQLLKEAPVTTELITARDIERSVARTAAEALESEIGISVREDFAGKGVMLQGVDPDKVLILVDGNRVIGRVNGSIDLEQLSTQGVRQIEVVKGAASTLYGSEAIGGVINIITEEPTDPLRVSLDLSGGGFLPSGDDFPVDPAKGGGVVNPSGQVSWRAGPLGLRAGLRYLGRPVVDINPETKHTDGVEGVRRFSEDLRADYQLSEHWKAIFNARGMQEEKEWVEGALVPFGGDSVEIPFDDRESNFRRDLSLELRHQPVWGEHGSVGIYHTYNSHDWGKYSQAGERIDYTATEEDYLKASAQITKKVGAYNRLTLGADAYRWAIETRSEIGIANSYIKDELTAWDAFVQDELYVGPVTLVPGVRYEFHDKYGSHVSPKISAMLSATDDLKVRLSAAEGYRAPTSKELYYVFDHVSAGYKVIGNPELAPETSANFTFGLEHTYEDRTSSRITFFYNDMQDLIDFYLIEAPDSVANDYELGWYEYRNISSAYTAGVELERSMRFGGDWQFSVGYTFLQTHNRDTGEMLLRRPPHTGRAILTWTPGPWMARVNASYTGAMLFQGEADTDAATSDEWTNAYAMFDLSLSREVAASLTAYLKVDNLLDTVHARYGPYQGRLLLGGLRWTWAPLAR